MQIRKEEIRTGLLVVVSIAIVTGVLLAIAAPGVFKPVHVYNVFFDNAGGLKLGGPVMLGGRKIGQVTKLLSPVPQQDRPPKFPNYEVAVECTVDRSAKIYKEVRVRLLSYSLLGEEVVDFSSGDENTGFAPSGAYFIGERQKDFTESISDAVKVIKDTVVPVAEEAKKTMVELQSTADSLKQMTQPGGNVDQAVVNFRDFGHNLVELSGSGGKVQVLLDNLQTLTGTDSHLSDALKNADKLASDLANNKDIQVSLQNFRQASEQLKSTLNDVGPKIQTIGTNLEQATDTVKHQPWRIVWPTTKKYPGEPRAPRVQTQQR